MTSRPRLTIRLRLALLYAATSAAAIAAALGGVYLVMFGLLTPAVGPTPPIPTNSTASAPVPPDGLTPTQDASQVLDTLLRACGVVLLVCSLGALVMGWIVAGRMLAPIRRVTLTAAGIAAGNLHERVALRGPDDEVKELADTFDGMLARLEASFDGYRRFAADASHELLTPLATSQALLDVAAASPRACDVPALLADLTEVNARSEQIVNALLDLARAEHGIIAASTVDLAGFARDAVAVTSGEASHRDVSVVSRLDPVPVTGDPTLLRQLVTNLVTNAIRHNKPGGRASITVSADRGRAVMTVSNTGFPVTEDELKQLFEPFTRATGRTRHGSGDGPGGHGLGLAIVHAVTTAHHGTLTATPNPDGGLTVLITLPLDGRQS
ncbi:sensor histidine kinase [Nonomuraea sp. NPDC049480]|uniref:sensor histidine kinase n=1 Tax=Nonomuraea sp. NPDC049480 TaxID=3364353 RepID=UPI003792951D